MFRADIYFSHVEEMFYLFSWKGCDDGSVKVWLVPNSGLTEATNTPDKVLQAHTEKIYCLKFHPLASDILATTSYDVTIRIWDLSSLQQAYCLRTDDHVNISVKLDNI